MKKRQTITFFLLTITLLGVFVIAQNESLDISEEDINEAVSEIEDIDAGYINGLDRALDNIRLRLSGNDPAIGLQIAQERLEEIKQLRIEGKVDEAEEIAKKHKEVLAKVKEKINESNDDEDLKSNLKIRAALEVHEVAFEDLKARIEELSPQERLELLKILVGSEEELQDFRLRLENAEDNIIIRLEQKEGRSASKIRSDLYRLQEHVKLKAEVYEDFSVINVEYRFRQKIATPSNDSVTVDQLLEKILNNIQLSEEEVASLIKIVDGSDDNESDVEDEFESKVTGEVITGFASGSGKDGDGDKEKDDEDDDDDDDDDDGDSSIKTEEDDDNDIEENNDYSEREQNFGPLSNTTNRTDENNEDEENDDGEISNKLRVFIEIKEKDERTEAQVQFRLRFASNSTQEKGIINDYVSAVNRLNKEILYNHARIKHEIKRNLDKEGERRIEVRVREREGINQAEVKIEWDGEKNQFIIQSDNKEQIIEEIAIRLNVSVEEVTNSLKKFELKNQNKIQPDDDKDEREDDEDDDDSSIETDEDDEDDEDSSKDEELNDVPEEERNRSGSNSGSDN